jgi:hypothetical protein
MTKAQSLEPIPLRPDPGALRERNVKALVRACIATARARYHRGIEPGDIVERAWSTDGTARLILRAASEPRATIGGTPALARTVVPDFVQAMTPFSASKCDACDFARVRAREGFTLHASSSFNLASVVACARRLVLWKPSPRSAGVARTAKSQPAATPPHPRQAA